MAHQGQHPDGAGGDRPDPLHDAPPGGPELLDGPHAGLGVVDRAALAGPALSSGSCMKPTNSGLPKAASRWAWASMAPSWPPAAMSAQQRFAPPNTRLSQPSNRIRPSAA